MESSEGLKFFSTLKLCQSNFLRFPIRSSISEMLNLSRMCKNGSQTKLVFGYILRSCFVGALEGPPQYSCNCSRQHLPQSPRWQLTSFNIVSTARCVSGNANQPYIHEFVRFRHNPGMFLGPAESSQPKPGMAPKRGSKTGSKTGPKREARHVVDRPLKDSRTAAKRRGSLLHMEIKQALASWIATALQRSSQASYEMSVGLSHLFWSL